MLSGTPSLPILLAVARDGSLKGKLKDAWAFTTVNAERTRAIGDAIEATGVVELALERMNRELDAAVDALGPYAQRGTGTELVDWARKLSVGMSAQAQERSRAA